MKGHTRIELRDVDTGEIEVHEDDNMVTNALQLYFAAAGWHIYNMLENDNIRSYPLWQTFLGGLFLFDTALEEDVSNVIPAAGVKMVGNGSYGVSNSTEVTELGSYNETESGIQDDGTLKLVWDFSTAQANGTIACACLTSRFGGYYGCGNAASGIKMTADPATVNGLGWTYGIQKSLSTNTRNRNLNNTWTAFLQGSRTFPCMLYVDYEGNDLMVMDQTTLYYNETYESSCWYNTGYLVINKWHYSMSSIDIKENWYLDKIVESYKIPVPDAIKTYIGSTYKNNNYYIATNGKNIYVFFCTATAPSLPNGEEFYVMKIDKDMSVTTYKCTNATGVDLYAAIRADAYPTLLVSSEEYMFFATNGTPRYMYGIKLSDSTDVVQIEGSWTGEAYFNDLGNDRLIRNIGSNTQGIFDLKAKKLLNANGVVNQWTELVKPVIGNPILLCEISSGYNSQTYSTIYRRCDYLATINNLETPVVKTASKTMKVTYTVTFD